MRSPQNLKKKAPFLFESNQKHQNKVGVFFKFLRTSKNICTLDINLDVFNSYPSFRTSDRSKSKIRTEFLQTEYRITWNSSQEIAGHSSPLREAAWTLMHAWRPTDCWESSSRPMWKVATDICKRKDKIILAWTNILFQDHQATFLVHNYCKFGIINIPNS